MPRVSARRPAWTVSHPPWKPAFAEIFRLAADDWRPPTHMTVRANASRTRMISEARFHKPDGMRVALSMRLTKAADGQWYADQERLDVRLTWKPEVVN